MSQERSTTRLLMGTMAFAAGLAAGGAYLVKDLELSTEWFIEAPPSRVFATLCATDRYALWWPAFAQRTNGAVAPIGPNLVVRCLLPVVVPRWRWLPPLRFTLRFPQVEPNVQIRARITGDITGVAEWLIVPQPHGVLLRGYVRARLSRPLLNLIVRCTPERTWRPAIEETLRQARDRLQRLLAPEVEASPSQRSRDEQTIQTEE